MFLALKKAPRAPGACAGRAAAGARPEPLPRSGAGGRSLCGAGRSPTRCARRAARGSPQPAEGAVAGRAEGEVGQRDARGWARGKAEREVTELRGQLRRAAGWAGGWRPHSVTRGLCWPGLSHHSAPGCAFHSRVCRLGRLAGPGSGCLAAGRVSALSVGTLRGTAGSCSGGEGWSELALPLQERRRGSQSGF